MGCFSRNACLCCSIPACNNSWITMDKRYFTNYTDHIIESYMRNALSMACSGILLNSCRKYKSVFGNSWFYNNSLYSYLSCSCWSHYNQHHSNRSNTYMDRCCKLICVYCSIPPCNKSWIAMDKYYCYCRSDYPIIKSYLRDTLSMACCCLLR